MCTAIVKLRDPCESTDGVRKEQTWEILQENNDPINQLSLKYLDQLNYPPNRLKLYSL